MSYINVESRGFQYRVVVAHHKKATPASQIPDDCTAILLEGSANRRETMFDALAGAKRLERSIFGVQYPKIREHAQRRNLPLVAAEPLAVLEALTFGESFISPIDVIRLRLTGGSLIRLTKREEEVQIGDKDFVKAKEFIAFYIRKNPNTLMRAKDLLFAEKAVAFAEFQARSGVKRPRLVIVAGALHLGTAEELIRSREERLAEILSNDQIKRYYQSNNLGDIHYVTYNPRKHLWSEHVLMDHRFKRK